MSGVKGSASSRPAEKAKKATQYDANQQRSNVGHSPGSVAATSAVAAANRAAAAATTTSSPATVTEREAAPSADGFPYISEALRYALPTLVRCLIYPLMIDICVVVMRKRERIKRKVARRRIKAKVAPRLQIQTMMTSMILPQVRKLLMMLILAMVK
jgi:hypothetical protein